MNDDPHHARSTDAPKGGRSPLRDRLTLLFGLDRRSMATFRIGLGLMLLADWIKRSLALSDHYTREGILPLSTAMSGELPIPIWPLRIFFLSDEPLIQSGLFVIAGLLAISVALGYRTRLSLFLTLLFLASIQRRNPFACHTGDSLLIALVVWGLFLPLGAYFSMDERRRPQRPPLPPQFLSVGTVALGLQIAVFYFAAGWLKHSHDIWMSGRAVAEFAAIDSYTTRWGEWLRDYPGITRFATYFTLVLELGGPLLLFFPFATGWVRLVGIVLLASFHLGIQITVYIGIFELVSVVALLALLPPLFWDRVLPWLRRRPACDPAPQPRGPSTRWSFGSIVTNGLASVALLIMLAYNVRSLRESKELWIQSPAFEEFEKACRMLGLAQDWVIFTNLHDRPNGWYLIVGELEDGTVVNVPRGPALRVPRSSRAPRGLVRQPQHAAHLEPRRAAPLRRTAAPDRVLALPQVESRTRPAARAPDHVHGRRHPRRRRPALHAPAPRVQGRTRQGRPARLACVLREGPGAHVRAAERGVRFRGARGVACTQGSRDSVDTRRGAPESSLAPTVRGGVDRISK